MKTIYGYYESIPTVRQEEEFACANLWKGSWESNGWKTVMLNKTHAAGSPLLRNLMEKYVKEATPQVAASRFTRWCALHAVGGGWMSDYDLLNLGFTPKMAEEIELLHSKQLVAGARSYIFYATKDGVEQVIRKFIEGELLFDGIPVPESEIVGGEPSGLYPILPYLFHPSRDDEQSRSQSMAAKIS